MAKRGRKPGTPKTGGRKAGTPNKPKGETAAALAATGALPLDHMLSVMRDPAASVTRRDEMAKAAAPFVHAKLSAVAVTQEAKVTIAEDYSDKTEARRTLCWWAETIARKRGLKSPPFGVDGSQELETYERWVVAILSNPVLNPHGARSIIAALEAPDDCPQIAGPAPVDVPA